MSLPGLPSPSPAPSRTDEISLWRIAPPREGSRGGKLVSCSAGALRPGCPLDRSEGSWSTSKDAGVTKVKVMTLATWGLTGGLAGCSVHQVGVVIAHGPWERKEAAFSQSFWGFCKVVKH